MDVRLKRSASASFLLHLLVLALMILYVPQPKLGAPGEPDEIQMEFAGPSHRGPRTHKSAAPVQSEQHEPKREAAPARLGSETSHHAVEHKATPKPPPPPPIPQRVVPTPPRPVPTPPLVPQAANPVPMPPPPPVRQPPKARPAKPVPTPARPKQSTEQKRSQPETEADSSALSSALSALRAGHAHGKREGKADSAGSMDNALASLRAGGAAEAGGNPNASNDNGGLTAGDRGRIADGVRRCWDYDAGAKDAASFSVELRVVTDQRGVARMVTFAPRESGHLGADPAFRAFSERARRAVLNPTCASLALPSGMLGRNETIDFRFRP